MKVNGEAIYGSRMYSSFNEGDSIRFTQSKDGDTKYVFFFEFPSGKKVLTKIKCSKNTKVQLLGSKEPVKWKSTEQGTEINLSARMKAATDHVWVLKVQD
jgi:alpha-L-fucosidase